MDAGKSIHDRRADATCVDLNRAGIALMEIVSEPDIRSPEEAGLYLRKLRSILRYIGTCDGNMEQGSLRADVNVSVRRPGGELGTRCEVKNLNSVRFVMKAIEIEAERQVSVLEDGGAIELETRLFDADRGETRSMRSKEEAHDYRYFPDPDLLPLTLDLAWVEAERAQLPELPDARKTRFMADYGLSAYVAGVLVADRKIAEKYEEAAIGRDPKLVANLFIGALFSALNRSKLDIDQSFVAAPAMGALAGLVKDGKVSSNTANTVIQTAFAENIHIRDEDGMVTFTEERGFWQVRRHGCDRGACRPGYCREPRQGRRLSRRQNEADGLVRRPGDEGVWRQGQPEGGQRGAAGEARRLSAGPRRQVPTLSSFATRGHPQWGAAGGRRLAFDAIGTHVPRAGLRSEVGTRLPASPTPFGHPPNAR